MSKGDKTGEFAGTVCIVTGGHRGIGRAIVEMMAAEGADVHSLDLAVQAPVPKGTMFPHVCDIAEAAAVEAIFAEFQHIDILVNNAAAVTPAMPLIQLPVVEWHRAININVTGTFNVTRAALPRMGKGGRIINIASTFAHVGAPGRVAYATSKGAVLSFSRSLALELAAQGIRVNSISPGGVTTDRLVEQFGSKEAAEAFLAPLHPIGHTGSASNIADAVWFLASEKSQFMTGADILVDGGYTAQ